MPKIGNISDSPGGAVINDTTESSETVYSSEKVAQLISEIELLPGPTGATGPAGAQGIQGNPGANGSDASVTKVNVEAVLTGNITSHYHPEEILYWNGSDKIDSPDTSHKYIVIEDRCQGGTINFNSMKENSEVTVITQRIEIDLEVQLICEDYRFLLNGVEMSILYLNQGVDDYKIFKLWYYTEISKIIVLSVEPYTLTKAAIEALLTGEISTHTHPENSSTSWGKYF